MILITTINTVITDDIKNEINIDEIKQRLSSDYTSEKYNDFAYKKDEEDNSFDNFKKDDIESLFDYEHIILSKNELLKLSNGMTTILELSKHAISNMEDLTNKKLKVYSSNNEFVGIANILKFDESNMFIKRDKYFVLNPNIST